MYARKSRPRVILIFAVVTSPRNLSMNIPAPLVQMNELSLYSSIVKV